MSRSNCGMSRVVIGILWALERITFSMLFIENQSINQSYGKIYHRKNFEFSHPFLSLYQPTHVPFILLNFYVFVH
jgi:hypothetical protein